MLQDFGYKGASPHNMRPGEFKDFFCVSAQTGSISIGILTLLLTTALSNAAAQTPWTTTNAFLTPVSGPAVTGPMAVSSAGDLYVTSNLVGFSQATGQFGDLSMGGTWVSHIAASGTPVFAVEIGGVHPIFAVGTDSNGNALLSGNATATGLPVTPGAWASVSSGDQTAFVCKLNAANGSPIFCTYLGSNQISIAAIGADATGNVYILARQTSAAISPTPGALSLGDRQILLIKLNPTGSTLLWAAAFGGSGTEVPVAMAVDASGNAYITGGTLSTDFPGTAAGALATPSNSFLAKIDPTGSKLIYSSYGAQGDNPYASAVDSSGAQYVAGISLGLSPGVSIYAMKITADGAHLGYHTIMPSSPSGQNPSLAVDGEGNAIVVGSTHALPYAHVLTATCREADLTYPALGPAEAFMVRFAPDGTILQSTPVGTGTVPVVPFAIGGASDKAWIAVAPLGLNSVGLLQIGPDTLGTSFTSIGCVVNAVNFVSGQLSPGEIFSIFGEGLGPVVGTVATLNANSRFPTSLGGAQVSFDGIPAPLLYVADGQINAITPWELAGKTQTKLCASYSGTTSCTTLLLGQAAPGILTADSLHAEAVNQDGTINSLANPARFGSVVSLYLTGLGPISPMPPDGSLTQLPVPALQYPVAVTLTGTIINFQVPGDVLYAGPAPLEVGGLFQINVVVPTFPFTVTVQVTTTGGMVVTSPRLTIATAP